MVGFFYKQLVFVMKSFIKHQFIVNQLTDTRNMKKVLIVIILLSSFKNQITAQIANQNNGWIFYNGNHKITEKIGLHTEFQWRRNDFLSKPMQNETRLGVDYTINQKVKFTAGWSYTDTFAYGDFKNELPAKYNQYRFYENDAWEQLQLKHDNIGRFSFDSRFRLEQRWIENKVKDANGNYVIDNESISGVNAKPIKFRQRLRYMYRVQVPLSKSEMKDNTLFFAASDEIFLNFGAGVSNNVFDQNRLYLAFGWRFNKDFNIQTGYMNQFIQRGDGLHKENNHTFQLGINYNIDFTKIAKQKNNNL